MKLDILIILSSNGEFHPFVSQKYPKFKLPFLNISLLDLTLNYLASCSENIFIVCHESQASQVHEMVAKRCNYIEILSLKNFEGMSVVLNTMRRKIKTQYFIMCKGDVFGLEPLYPLLNELLETRDDLYCSIERVSKGGTLMCTDLYNRLLMYNSKEIPYPNNCKIHLSVEYKMKDFFILKTSAIGNFTENLFRFKDHVIPALLDKNKSIRVYENSIYQIRSLSEYMYQIGFKTHFLAHHERMHKNLLGQNCFIEKNALIEDCVIGDSVTIGRNVVLKKCVIMKGAKIKSNCVIEDCIIGHFSNIAEKCYLKKCKIANSFVILSSITAEGTIFSEM